MTEDQPFPPCPEPFNLAAHVLQKADRAPSKIALEVVGATQPEVWRYDQLKKAVLGTATGLLKLGLLPGDVVLLRLANTVDFPISYLAALAVGLVPAPVSSALTASEVATIINRLSPKAILSASDLPCPDHGTIIDQAKLRRLRSLPPAGYQMGDPNRLGYIIHTSGTGADPKAVMHAHRAIWARQMMIADWEGISEQDRVLHAGAFNWTYTLGTGLMDPWTQGATALIPAPGVESQAFPALLAEHRATIFAAAPGVYRQMLKQDVWPDMPDLRFGLSAGEKLPPSLRAAWEARAGTPIFEAYGMSECSTFISASPKRPAAPETLGRAQPGRRVAILDEDGTPCMAGIPGMIAVHRSDHGLMLGYLNAKENWTADWFLTGDLGQIDAKGQVTYLGRADDLMNAGGFRVSPLEVEQAFENHPNLNGIAVTDVEIKDDVRVIAAFYTSNQPVQEAQLKAHAAQKLAKYKRPRLYVAVPALTYGPNGKLQRRAMRVAFEAGKYEPDHQT